MAIQKLDISPLGASGTIWNGNVGVSSGTITSLPNIPGGTITNLASGTINAATAVLNSGTINVGTFVMPSGTLTVLPNLPQGSINVTAGTIATLGTMGTLGLVNTVTTVSNVTNGSIVVTAGTIAAHAITAATITAGTLTNLVSGTINAATAVINSATISVLPNLPQGSINVTAGTITSGSIRVVAGTVGGAGATAVALSGNPIPMAGVDTGGTVYGFLVDTKGQQYIGGGTVNMLNAGTITTLPNIPGGTINLVTTVSNLTNGSVAVTAGTINTGTINSGTISSATISAATINAGTFTVTSGSIAVTTGTISGGTLKDNFGAIGTATITIAALASSTVGVGRQSDLIDNTTNLYSGAIIGAQITAGSVTTANQLISLYLIRSDNGGGPIADDAAGTGDAGWTQNNAPLLGNILVPAVGTAVQYKAVFDTSALGHLGPKWGIGIVNSTGNALHATAGSHSITYTAYNAKF